MRRLFYALALAGCADAESPTDVTLREAEFLVTVTNTAAEGALVAADGTDVGAAFSPGAWVVRASAEPGLFEAGRTATAGEEVLAESGHVRDLLRELASVADNRGTFGGDSESSYGDQPLFSGDQVSFGFRATEGQALSFATMFGESNDTVARGQEHPLFDDSGVPTSTRLVVVYVDAGTERNEELGVGPNQGPRQSEPTAGEVEALRMTEFETTGPQGFEFPTPSSVRVVDITGTLLAEE